jgi:uncharacterized membrane protein YtjA (UPF0391 family)
MMSHAAWPSVAAALEQAGYVSGGFIGLLLAGQAQILFLLFHVLFLVPFRLFRTWLCSSQ